ncbi:MAG: hypothetical protein GX493_04130 [Firmicutes bacterium]|nr:hypothetical protein [Bacillota bacterium]
MAVAERLGYDRETRHQIYLACKFLALEYSFPGTGLPSPGEPTDWEDVAIAEVPLSRRLVLHQQTAFKAWAIKRAVEEETFWPHPRHPAHLIAACRDYLLGRDPGAHEAELWKTVEKTAAELLLQQEGGGGPLAAEKGLPPERRRAGRQKGTTPSSYPAPPSAAPKKKA